MSLYCVTQHCCSKIQIGFHSVFPAGNLQMRGMQLRLCRDHTASETKILWSRCCCSEAPSSYLATGSFPRTGLRVFSENRGNGFCEAYAEVQLCPPLTKGAIPSLLKLLEWEQVLLEQDSCIFPRFPICHYKSAICAHKYKFYVWADP